MTPNTYVIDTHALLWYLGQSERLSERVGNILNDADEDDTTILIPTIVLAEALAIIEKKKVQTTLSEVTEALQDTDRFSIVPFDVPVFEHMMRLPASLELHDRIIAATVRLHDCALMSRDGVLSRTVETVW